MMLPPLISETPLGKEPSTVKPGVPVLLALIKTPELIVAATLDVPGQPALTASERKLALVWLLEIVKANSFDLPLKSVIAIVAGLAPTPARVRTAASFKEIVAVEDKPNSVLI
jgi:hypothetical protein